MITSRPLRKTILKRWAACLLMLLSLSTVGALKAEPTPDRVLVVGSEIDYPPFAIVNDRGEADGFTVDLFKAVAQVMELKVRFRTGPWDEVRTALERGEIDALPLVSYSAEREKLFDFTLPHTVSYAAAFIRKGEDGVDSEEALRGRRIIAMAADATHDYLVERKVTDDLIMVKTVPDALRKLSSGDGDLALLPRLTGLLTAKELGLTNIGISGPKISVYGRGYGFAVLEGNAALLAQLNQGLSIVKATGKYDALYDKWFGVVDPRGVSKEVIYKYSAAVGGVFMAILALALAWSWSLKREVAQRRKAEAKMLIAKESAETANRAKSDFLANMSHELRTPLHAILGFSQLMQRDRELKGEHRESLEIIGRSGEHLLELINDVLEMSKIEEGKITLNQEVIDLPRTFRDIAKMMRIRAEEKALEFTVALSPDLPRHVRADAGKLRQALINLIGNGVKFTEQGGVAFRARVREPAPKGEDKTPLHLTCEVEDTGIGIAEEDIHAIFDPFIQIGKSRGAMAGTGLGLTITRHYIELMGGALEVSSQPKRGTLFRFHLPVVPVSASTFDQEHRPRRVVGLKLEPGRKPPRILIVEDVRESRLFLKKLLTDVGLDVREAENGREAVEQFEQWLPHLIWMDIRMPVMDGYEATGRIKNHPKGPATWVIALTASVFEKDRETILAAGCDDIVSKPFQENDIFDCMAERLNLRFLHEGETPETADAQEEDDPDRASLLARLSNLPREVWDDLQNQVTLLDADRMIAAIDHIEKSDPTLARALRRMIDEYRLEELSSLMDAASQAAEPED